jgi:hypothetical protein
MGTAAQQTHEQSMTVEPDEVGPKADSGLILFFTGGY